MKHSKFCDIEMARIEERENGVCDCYMKKASKYKCENCGRRFSLKNKANEILGKDMVIGCPFCFKAKAYKT